MNKKKVIVIATVFVAIGVCTALLFNTIVFTSHFATEISLRYKYGLEDIEVKIADSKDIEELKSILNGVIYKDTPSCGFSTDISITLTNGEKTVVLCPALDGCATIRVDESNRYISISASGRQRLDEILGRYGFRFPSL